ncbi:MAG: Ppx/GppA family phosphatase [Proteobacteria bacterium]|nr:Ppx/GppA family phosphatase [Pseudomonadota bacterium]
MSAPQPRDVAVVDVGSNSVRLVLYRVEGRAIWTVHNEKVLAGLGRGLDASRRLNPEGAAAALAALRRFRAVLDGARPAEIHTAATAAVREAEDGPDFVARVREQAGLELHVLSGEEEARWAALGVIAGAPGANGVVGDLGGSSLELMRIGGGEVGQGVTLPLGPFAMGAAKDYDVGRARKEALKRLETVADSYGTEVFHAVGGAWRNLALLHMRMAGYPLHVVHQYRLDAREALELARLIARQSRSSLERMPGVSRKRLETLPHAAVLLETVIERLGCERVVFSAYGVREGMIYDAMPPELRARDPLVEGCAALGARLGVAEGLGQALEQWLAPVLAALPPTFRGERGFTLLAAAARLADIGARLHPDHRGALAFNQVLRAPIAGQTHGERAFLAAAIFNRYGADEAMPEASTIGRVLSPERLVRARAMGLALRLGCDLSGRSAALLGRSRLRIESHDLVLTAEPEAADLLLGEQTRKRLSAVAAHLELTPVMRTA